MTIMKQTGMIVENLAKLLPLTQQYIIKYPPNYLIRYLPILLMLLSIKHALNSVEYKFYLVGFEFFSYRVSNI